MAAVVCLAIMAGAVHAESPEEVWRTRGPGGSGTAFDNTYHFSSASRALGVADAAGNVYVTTRATNSLNFDVATAKFDPQGNVLWSRLYNGPGSDDDDVRAIAIDPTGGVAITAASTALDMTRDILTLRYDAAGTLLWSATHTGSGSEDEPEAIAIDGAGATLVAGYSTAPDAAGRMTLLKYDSTGMLLWSRDIGGGIGDARATAVAIDAADNVLVTGTVSGSGVDSDVSTRKYDPAGNLLWSHDYDGIDAGDDAATALALDASGNVFVAGSTTMRGDTDYLLLKIDLAGTLLWERTHDGGGDDSARAIALDELGAAYLTGDLRIDGLFHAGTLKYDAAGHLQWQHAFASAQPDTYGRAVSIGVDGDVYVGARAAGRNNEAMLTVRYHASGSLHWSRSHGEQRFGHADSVLPAPDGGVFVTGMDDMRAVVLRHDAAGETAWWSNVPVQGLPERFADVPGNLRHAMTTDAAGSIYVVGQTRDDVASRTRLIKFDAQGRIAWTTVGEDAANTSIAVAPDGSVVTGGHRLAWFDAQGQPLWAVPMDVPHAETMALDAEGNILVSGTVMCETGRCWRIVKYGTDGGMLWSRIYGHTNGDQWASPSAMTVDDAGNVYVSGKVHVNALFGASANVALVKFDANGNLLWSDVLDTRNPSNGNGVALARDAAGNIHIAGYGDNSYTSHRMLLMKYTSDGTRLWHTSWLGLDTVSEARDVAVDAAGHVYAAGFVADAGGTHDIALVKFDAAGSILWERRFGEPGIDEQGIALALNTDGHPHVTGRADNGGQLQFVTLKFDDGGAHVWTHRFAGDRIADDVAEAIVPTPDGAVVVAGTEAQDTGSDRIVLLRLQDREDRGPDVFRDGFEAPLPP